MNDQLQSSQQRQKKPYQQPQLIKVPLRPDEAVLGGCKTSAGNTAGPGSSNCRQTGNCFSLSS